MKLLDYIKSHNDWEELLSHDPYNLKISRDDGYIMFKYDQIASDFSYEVVREARGIIFYEQTWDCVCHPFNKFGNYGESYCPNIDWNTASVQEKVDGSFIKVWYHNNEWHVSTNGTIDAFKANLNDNLKFKTFGDLFSAAINHYFQYENWNEAVDPTCTYMFELVSPFNRVVIPYEKIDCYFLGWRDNRTDKELNPKDCFLSDYFPIPKRYKLNTLTDVLNAANALPWDKEGYVVCDEYFNRVKIKSPQYVMAHYMRNNNVINEERLVQVVLDGEQAEFSIYASDYIDDLIQIETLMKEIADSAVKQVKTIYGAQYEFENRGQYARDVLKTPNYMRDFLFHCFDDRIFWDYAKSWSAEKWLKAINELRERKQNA